MGLVTDLMPAIGSALPAIIGWGIPILLALIAGRVFTGIPSGPDANATGLNPTDCFTGDSGGC